ncbi:CAP domain-containing protein [Ralstonia sp.]|uniref:CAP domain-containing protein n=1 Tax=Ralstonia sp. TaxID=54061 RepID=UPI002C24FDE2|nr:CAP domain-containing protein [Ralstonia sp.]HWV05760.1 CAP domain-containing protein [Ralstonia sp.]
MTQKLSLLAYTLACALSLSACGGGNDATTSAGAGTPANGTPSSPTQSVPGTVAMPQYASTSAQLAMFNAINQYRAQCGFPALQENTILDEAAQAHAKYEGLNSVVADTETQGNPGFTGVTGADTAATFGWPAGVFTGRGDAGFYNATPRLAVHFSTQQASRETAHARHDSRHAHPRALKWPTGSDRSPPARSARIKQKPNLPQLRIPGRRRSFSV